MQGVCKVNQLVHRCAGPLLPEQHTHSCKENHLHWVQAVCVKYSTVQLVCTHCETDLGLLDCGRSRETSGSGLVLGMLRSSGLCKETAFDLWTANHLYGHCQPGDPLLSTHLLGLHSAIIGQLLA